MNYLEHRIARAPDPVHVRNLEHDSRQATASVINNSYKADTKPHTAGNSAHINRPHTVSNGSGSSEYGRPVEASDG